MLFCSKCGTQLVDGADRCHACNTFLPSAQASEGMVMDILKKTLSYVLTKPFRLWGLSLMAEVLIFAAACFWAVPVVGVAAAFVIQLGMMGIFLNAYRKKSISVEQLFTNFFNKQFIKSAGGMFWMYLWMGLWLCVPIAGIVKMYSYRFTPYILNEEPDTNAFDALEKSMALTKGYRLKMWLVDLLLGAALCFIFLILLLPGTLLMTSSPVAGIILLLPGLLITTLISLITPLIFGVISAAFYHEVTKQR